MMRGDSKDLTIAIDARAELGSSGGVDEVLVGLLTGLSSLEDGCESYVYLGFEGSREWLQEFAGPRDRLLLTDAGKPKRRRGAAERAAQILAQNRVVQRLPGLKPTPPRSDGTLEGTGADVVHFTRQAAFLTGVPSIFLPHDLQHQYLPHFFSARELARRNLSYGAFCRQASVVSVMTASAREDVVDAYGVEPGRIGVIQWPPAHGSRGRLSARCLDEVTGRLSLPRKFAFFPAQTLPHKNHLALLEALALLSRRGLEIPVVFCGRETEHAEVLRERAKTLHVAHQLRWLGHVDDESIEALYRRATCIVFPSRFEGWGMPVVEALEFGVPLICSRLRHYPELLGDAALFFHPDRPADLAHALELVWTDSSLARELVRRGLSRRLDRDWSDVARDFRAQYRLVGGSSLTGDDEERLERQGIDVAGVRRGE
jgi:glycosyltransferase involved in cell wall biosynthesis